MRHRPVFHHARIEPLPDQSEHHTVAYPLLEKLPQMGMIQRVEKLADIDLQETAYPAPHGLLRETIQRIMRRSPRPEPIRAVVKVLLVDRLQQHHDRPLEHFVLQRRNADGAGLSAGAFRDMHPSHRRRPVRPRLRAFQERPKVPLQVFLVVRRRLAVHSHRAVLARPPISLTQPCQIEVLVQGSQSLLRHLLRQLCYPSLSRRHDSGVRGLRHVSLQRSDNSTPRFPPPGPRGASSPASTVLSGRYDFLSSVPPHFVAFAWRYHPSARVSPARGRALPRAGILELVTRYLRPGDWSVETTGSPTFLGNPDCALALLFDPGRTGAPSHIGASARPPICPPRRLPHSYFRGSITRLRHWLSTLRRPGRPDTTQDSLPAAGQALPDGLDYPQGSYERFRGVSYISASFPKFNVAQGHNTNFATELNADYANVAIVRIGHCVPG